MESLKLKTRFHMNRSILFLHPLLLFIFSRTCLNSEIICLRFFLYLTTTQPIPKHTSIPLARFVLPLFAPSHSTNIPTPILTSGILPIIEISNKRVLKFMCILSSCF